MNIHVPKPEPTPYSGRQFAIEMAFDALLNRGSQAGLRLMPCLGMRYLPDQELEKNFVDACNAILTALEMEEGVRGWPQPPSDL